MPLPHADLLRLKRWNTPTIYNGWEQITRHDIAAAPPLERRRICRTRGDDPRRLSPRANPRAR